MKIIGIIAAASGLLIALFAATLYRVSVPGSYGENEIINIGLQQNQLMTFQFGLAILLAGVVLYGIGILDERLSETLRAEGVGTRSMPVADEYEDAPPMPDPDRKEPDDVQSLMDELGVTWDGEKYAFGGYRYDRLEDALAYARQQRI